MSFKLFFWTLWAMSMALMGTEVGLVLDGIIVTMPIWLPLGALYLKLLGDAMDPLPPGYVDPCRPTTLTRPRPTPPAG